MSESPSYDAELLHKRCADSFASYRQHMTEILYSDPPDFIPPSRWQVYRERIRDAWDVLLGRAHIGY